MRYDVKKFLFIGTADNRNAFFTEMQKLGIVHFIDINPGKGREVPQDIHTVVSAIKTVLGLPVLPQEERHDYSYADTIAEQIVNLKNRIESLEEELRVADLEIARLEVFGNFNLADIAYIEQNGKRKIQFFCAKTETHHDDVEGENLFYVGEDHGLDYYVAINSWPRSYQKMTEMNFERSLNALRERKREILADHTAKEEELKTYAKYDDLLHKALVIKHNSYQLSETKTYARGALEDNLFIVEGWVPEHKASMVDDVVEILKVHATEIAIEEDDVIPTYLENSGASALGEDLVHIYDTPSHTDADPSLWVLCAFSIFFAMIIGDGGYGLVFLAVALYLRFKFPKAKGAGKRFINLATVLTVSCVLWGVMTSSFFGIQLDIDNPLRKLSLLDWLAEKKAEYHLVHKDPTYVEYIKKFPEAASATNGTELLHAIKTEKNGAVSYIMHENFTKALMLEIALLVGIIHIALSFARYGKRNWSGIGWILALIGGYLYFPEYLKATSILHYAAGLPPSVGGQEGSILMGLGFSLAIFLALVQNKWLGLTEIPNVIQVFADILSYLRIYALALAGGIVSATINDMIGTMPFVIAMILVIAGHAVNMALGIMGGVIHGLRLNFLEWYHYSFEGGGKLFKPLELKNID